MAEIKTSRPYTIYVHKYIWSVYLTLPQSSREIQWLPSRELTRLNIRLDCGVRNASHTGVLSVILFRLRIKNNPKI